ncbi:hypothetical protein [Bdellovibrio sp. HCB288]|uniref:hypothetical protein n=1 Tax=Bdellovibrio sp. HCB288 TaxID=3394355 RepID=UPI0039B563CC
MRVLYGILIIGAFLLSACSLDINMLGGRTTGGDDAGVFPLGEKKTLFGTPYSLAQSPNGKIVVFDPNGSGAVFFLDSNLKNNGTISTYGTGDGQIYSARTVAVDSDNNVYVVDAGNNRVQKFGPEGQFIRKWGVLGSSPTSPYEFSTMYGIAVDSQKNVYVTNYYAAGHMAQIKVYDSDGSHLRTIGAFDDGVTCAGCPGYFNSITAITVDQYDNVYAMDMSAGRIHKFFADGSPTIAFGSVGSGNGQFPSNFTASMTVSSDDRLYVSQDIPARIQKFDLDGNYISDIGVAGSNPGELARPLSVIVLINGDLLVSDYPAGGVGKLERFSPTGVLVSTTRPGGTGVGQLGAVLGVAVNSQYMVVADTTNNRVVVYDSAGTWVRHFGSPGWDNGNFNRLISVGIDSANNIYVLDVDQQSTPAKAIVQKFNISGVFQTSWNGSTGGGTLVYSMGMTVSSAGEVFVADQSQHKIQKFDSNGVHLMDLGENALAAPLAVAIAPSGNLYVSDAAFGIVEVSGTNSAAVAVTSFGAGILSAGMAVTPDGKIYVADLLNNKINVYSPAGTLVTSWGEYGVEVGQFNAIFGITSDSSGNIYAADSSNCRIQRFTGVGIPF